MWATRPSFLFWGHIPQTPWEGAAPPPPHLPIPAGLGFARVLGPTRGGVAKVDYSPPLLVSWGDTPHTPRHGGSAPLDPPFPHPRRLRVCQRFGSHLWRGFQSGLLAPYFGFVGGHPPRPPPWGLRPLDPPFPHPRGPRVCRRFGSHSWRGCNLSCEGMKCPRQSPRKGYHNHLGLGFQLQPERYKLPIGLAVVAIPQQRAATSTEVTPRASPAVRVLIHRGWLERNATLT
jgi:hypothetical protein